MPRLCVFLHVAADVSASLMAFASAGSGVTCWFSQAVLIQLLPQLLSQSRSRAVSTELKWVTLVSAVLTGRILPEWAEPASGGREQDGGGGGNYWSGF